MLFIPEFIALTVLALILAPAYVAARRFTRAHSYRMKLLAFVESTRDPNERVYRFIWVLGQPGFDAFAKHRGDYDELLIGSLAADFSAWNAINSK